MIANADRIGTTTASRPVSRPAPRPRQGQVDVQSAFAEMKALWQAANVPSADYDADRPSRFLRPRRGLAPYGGTADYHNKNEAKFYERIEKARDMDRNDAVIGQTIDRSVANEIQDGFTLQINTGDKGLDDAIWQMWHSWSTNPDKCDIAGEMTFADYEAAASRSSKLDGDCVVTGVYHPEEAPTGPLQFFEGHCIGTNRPIKDVVLGVEMNSFRRRLRYYISSDLIDPNKTRGIGGFGASERAIDVRDAEGVRQVFHVLNPKRTTLTRGVTALAPVFQLAGMFEDINFAKVVQQQIVSCFAVFREIAANSGPDGTGLLPSNQGYGASTTETSVAGVRRLEGIAPGMEVTGRPGEKLQGFSPSVPNAEYFDHVRLILQLIGVNLGLPLCLVLMDGSETNFSGWRGAVDEARKGFRFNQKQLIKRFHTPVYLWKLRHFMADDATIRRALENKSGKVDVFAHRWQPQSWPYIDPLKDVQGDALTVQENLSSQRRIHAKLGNEWEDVIVEKIDDTAYGVLYAKKMAQQINKKFPNDNEPISWRELYMPPMPQGIGLSLSTGGVDALSLQQLALARERAIKAGDTKLAEQLGQQMEVSS